MSSESELTWEKVYEAVNNAVYQKFGEYMKDSEVEVLQGCWEGKTYPKIADLGNYSSSYIGRNIGPDLWKKLTEALGEKVSKTNCREALKRASLKSKQQIAATEIEFPEGVVPLESGFYVERSPIELNCYQEILQPGALLRIKAPQKMGKTSLLNRIIARAKDQNYRTVILNLREPDRSRFSNLDKFLRWFCACVSKKLGIATQLNNNWDEYLGGNVNCTTYFELHLLEEIESPLVLALDEVDRVFDYPEIYQDFFGLLRSWYEEAKNLPIWEKLRLVVAYS
ncbi:MAG: serine/threonine protein kinase, partial [Okeania sp. SIO2H7]|nr:serine/threonine protein kinase [Okeania sp. SIO2H7]